MSDDATRTRFLGAIAGQLPPARVIEVHLFGAIRQGGVESGVAVIAVDPNEAAPVEAPDVVDAQLVALPEVDAADEAGDDADVIAALDAEQEDAVRIAEADAPASVAEVLDEPVIDADGEVTTPDADDAQPGTIGDASDHAGYDAPVDALPEAPLAAKVPAPRYVVYTARYRHTLKGPDRGKWEASVTEEADAPLLTIDAVVRGVSRRSGEADETVRLSGEDFRAALPNPLPTPAVRALPIPRANPALRAPAAGRRA